MFIIFTSFVLKVKTTLAADGDHTYPKVCNYIYVEGTLDQVIGSVEKCSARDNARVVEQQRYLWKMDMREKKWLEQYVLSAYISRLISVPV